MQNEVNVVTSDVAANLAIIFPPYATLNEDWLF